MRISTSTIYQSSITKISDLQGDQSRLQQEISSGKRILAPSDDPLGASRILEIGNSQSVNTQYSKNRQVANTNLSGLDTSLGSITESLVSIRTTLVGSAGTITPEQRANLSTLLSSNLETLIGFANGQDATGKYLYAGYQTSTKPFSATATGAAYNGDSNQQYLQVDGQRQMAVTTPGDAVFQANGNDVFNTMSTLVTLLNNPSATSASVQAGIATAISSIQTATDNVSAIRTSVGVKLNELDVLDNVGSSRDLQYAQSLSSLQDLDYAQALSDVAQKQTILDAAQKSFVKITSLSMFDYIK